ncbi:MAG TPA: NlpC/P60 family protein [Bacillota bacterium]|nr:NlpC/P60 family protein [Bacillota bacterium]
MKESIRQHLVRAVNEIAKWSKKRKIATASGVIGCIALVAVLTAFTGTEVYSLEIAGVKAGYVTDKSMVPQAVNEITTEYADKETPLNLLIDKDAITCKATDLHQKEVTALTQKELEDKIIASKACKADGWAVNADGKNIAVTSTEKGANQILDGIKNHYLSSGSELISADFKESILVTKAAVSLSDIMEPDDAVSYLIAGKSGTQVYTVKDGDTLWDIAAANGVSIDELQKANPGFDPNKIQIGQQLNLFAAVPYLTVETKERITSAEKIDFNTVYEETGALLKGQTKVKTPGAFGSKTVCAEVTKENGVITGTTVLSSVVTAEPKDQVTLKGTKEATRYIASSRGVGRTVIIAAAAGDVVAYAEKFLGVPYKSGGSTPKGFDCSGFTQYVMKQFSGSLPRTTTGQYGSGVPISKSQLKAGDLVFFKPSSSSSKISHVGIYIGGGQFIHAPQPGEKVKISDLSSSYNVSHYYGAVRVLN